MNDEYLKFRKCLEAQLHNEFRVRIIINTTLDYFGYSKRTVFDGGQSSHIVYIRHVVFYICYSIYGITAPFISKKVKFNVDTVRYGNEQIREKLCDLKVQTDINNIRAKLVKVLNG